jgi:hypothetical protein
MKTENGKPVFSKDVQHLIDTFNPPPPKWVHQPVPNFILSDHPKLEEDKYWDEENRRWVEGHINERGEYIPPNQYFYIQNCMLKDVNGNYLRPLWRDADEMMATWSLECLKSGESLLIYKRREVGATAFFSNQGFWIWRTMPGTHCAYTSGKGQTGITAMFNSKILFSFNNFNKNVINPNTIQMSNSQTKTAFTIPMIQRINGEDVTKYCSLIARETSENPESVTNISGERAKYVYLDEGPLHTRLEKFLGSIFPVINEGVIRTGLMVIAGTVEPSLTETQISNFKKLITRSENLNLRTEILPVWVGMKYLDKNGWSNKEAGLLWYEEQKRKFQDSGDYIGARDFKMQYPRDEQDIFDINDGGMFEEATVEILKHRGNELQKMGDIEAQYKLIATSTGFEMLPDNKYRDPEKDGGFWMVEPPQQGITYYIAIDSIGSAKKDGGEKGSWIASVVFKAHDPAGRHYEPVNIYFERPQTIEQGYRNIVNQFTFYNKFDGVKEINYETNAATGDHLGTFLEKEDLYKKYAAKRKDLSGKGWTNTKKRGTPVNEHTREWQLKQANIFLRKHGMHFRSLKLIKQLLLPSEENADIRDAFLVFMTSIPNFDKPVEKKTEIRYRTDVQLTRDAAGRTVYKTVKVPIFDPKAQLDKTPMDLFYEFDRELKERYGEYGYQRGTAAEREKYRKLKLEANVLSDAN